MFKTLFNFYKTGQDLPPFSNNPEEIKQKYNKMRLSAFISITVGYGFFYVCRLSFSVAKKPMLDEGILDVHQMGIIGSALLFVYAFGRFINGFLADRSNIKKFMTTGLIVSALLNLLFGSITNFWFFLILWALNGWFQSMGSAPSAVVLSNWFSNRERGTRYGIWSICNHLGEGMTYYGTALIVSLFGWRWGFWGSGIICVLICIAMYKTLFDRPPTYGLPHISEYKNDFSESKNSKESVTELQLEVIKNWAVWVLGISSAAMYVARYAINNWAVLFLQETKGYDLVTAGSIVGINTIIGIISVTFSGFISDKFFHSKRNVPLLIYGILEILSLIIFLKIPPGNIYLDYLAMSFFGFSIGGLTVYLGGLMAIDICNKKATGAVMGTIGIFSYLGAAAQDWISGLLIENSKIIVGTQAIYNFNNAFYFWIGSSILAMLLPLTIWKVKHKS